MVGISLFMGGETTPSRGVVQSAGLAYRLGASVLKVEPLLGESGRQGRPQVEEVDGSKTGSTCRLVVST